MLKQYNPKTEQYNVAICRVYVKTYFYTGTARLNCTTTHSGNDDNDHNNNDNSNTTTTTTTTTAAANNNKNNNNNNNNNNKYPLSQNIQAGIWRGITNHLIAG